jgi:hypothetical protein
MLSMMVVPHAWEGEAAIPRRSSAPRSSSSGSSEGATYELGPALEGDWEKRRTEGCNGDNAGQQARQR